MPSISHRLRRLERRMRVGDPMAELERLTDDELDECIERLTALIEAGSAELDKSRCPS